MKIGLYHANSAKVNGCYKVVHNLIRGLRSIGHEVIENAPGDYTGCLQGIDALWKKKVPQNAVIGPEIVVLPTESPDSFAHYKRWVQPAQWVIDYMCDFKEIAECKMNVWPVGIDTARFNSIGRGTIFEYDCFIYYKNVTKQNDEKALNELKQTLDRMKIRHITLEYGRYTEEHKILAAKKCRCGIYFAGTESQGIALMEILSMGCPVYVIDQPLFKYRDYQKRCATSAPYFDCRCGIKSENFLHFQEFYDKIDEYDPRGYILENHTLEHGAKKYIDILTCK